MCLVNKQQHVDNMHSSSKDCKIISSLFFTLYSPELPFLNKLAHVLKRLAALRSRCSGEFF